MIKASSLEEFKQRKTSGKVTLALSFLFPAIGVVCLLAPGAVFEAVPYALGGAMVLVAVAGLVAEIADYKSEERAGTVGSYLMTGVLGALMVALGESAIGFMGVVWGVMGLMKAAREIDEAVETMVSGGRFVIRFALAAVNAALAVLLVANPFGNFEHHLILLGIELLLYPFELKREKDGKFVLEAEA